MCKCKKKRKMQPQVVCESMMSALKKNKVRKRGGACGWIVRLNFSKGQLGKLTERRCALEPGPEQAATQQDESAERERRESGAMLRNHENGVCKGERGR